MGVQVGTSWERTRAHLGAVGGGWTGISVGLSACEDWMSGWEFGGHGSYCSGGAPPMGIRERGPCESGSGLETLTGTAVYMASSQSQGHW